MMSWAWLDKLQPWKEEGRLCLLVRKQLLIKSRKQPLQKLTAKLHIPAAKESMMKNKGAALFRSLSQRQETCLSLKPTVGSDFFPPLRRTFMLQHLHTLAFLTIHQAFFFPAVLLFMAQISFQNLPSQAYLFSKDGFKFFYWLLLPKVAFPFSMC